MINGINQVDGELCIRSSDLNSYKNTFALSRIEKKKTHDFVDRKHGASVLKPVVFRIFFT